MQAIISKNSARLQAIDLITDLIFSGELTPDARINESQLARRFAVSQTPIREALLALQGEGFLLSQPDRGFFVKPLDLSELEGMYPVLAQLETMALGTIIAFPKSRLNRMKAINRKLATARGKEAVALDNAWHEELLSDCPNAYLLNAIARTRRDLLRYETLYFLEQGSPETSAKEHEAIMEMIERGDMEAATNALSRNCLNTINEMSAWLEARA